MGNGVDKFGVLVCQCVIWLGCFMVFNATINNILIKSWRAVLLVEETAVSAENHIPVLRVTVDDYPFWYH